jgi:hypothetical protein
VLKNIILGFSPELKVFFEQNIATLSIQDVAQRDVRQGQQRSCSVEHLIKISLKSDAHDEEGI